MSTQDYFTEITASALPHTGTQATSTSLLDLLPNIIAIVDPQSRQAPIGEEARAKLAATLRDLQRTMLSRKLDLSIEDWTLEAHGAKKVKHIVNLRRTNESPQGIHSVFILPVYKGPNGKLCTTVQHQLRPHAAPARVHLEIPAGKFDDGDISTEATAARELEEETGLVWDHLHKEPIARSGHHCRDGGLTNAKGEVLVVPVDWDERRANALSSDEQAQGLGQIHQFPIGLIPEYVEHCLDSGLGVTGTISNIALGMKLQRYVDAAHKA